MKQPVLLRRLFALVITLALGVSAATSLHDAARANDASAVTALLHSDIHVDFLDENDWTPLMMAAFYDSAQAAELLIDNGADVNAEDADGFTPLMMTTQNDATITAQ